MCSVLESAGGRAAGGRRGRRMGEAGRRGGVPLLVRGVCASECAGVLELSEAKASPALSRPTRRRRAPAAPGRSADSERARPRLASLLSSLSASLFCYAPCSSVMSPSAAPPRRAFVTLLTNARYLPGLVRQLSPLRRRSASIESLTLEQPPLAARPRPHAQAGRHQVPARRPHHAVVPRRAPRSPRSSGAFLLSHRAPFLG